MMSVRAVNNFSVFRSTSSPPLSILRHRLSHRSFRTSTLHRGRYSKSVLRFSISRSDLPFLLCGNVRCYSLYSFVDMVMEELNSLRKRKRVCSAIKLTTGGELVDDKLLNQPLEKGKLLEFKKDSDKVLLAVAERRDGKKNWMVYDQVLVQKQLKCGNVE